MRRAFLATFFFIARRPAVFCGVFCLAVVRPCLGSPLGANRGTRAPSRISAHPASPNTAHAFAFRFTSFFVLPPLRALRGITFPLLFLRSSPRRARPIKRKCGFSVLSARLLSFCFLARSASVLALVCRSAYSLPLVLPLRLPALSCAVLLLFLARPLSSVRFCFALPLPFLCFNFKSCILRNVIYMPFRAEFRRI